MIELFDEETWKDSQEGVASICSIITKHETALTSYGFDFTNYVNAAKLLDTKDKHAKTTLNDLLKAFGIESDFEKLQQTGKFLESSITLKEYVESLGIDFEPFESAFNTLKTAVTKNEISFDTLYNIFIDGLSAVDLFIDGCLDPSETILSSLIPSFDIGELDLEQLAKAFISILEEFDAEEFKEEIEFLNDFITLGVDLQQYLLDLLGVNWSEEEILEYFEPILMLFEDNTTLSTLIEAILETYLDEVFDIETYKTINNGIDLIGPNTTMEDAYYALGLSSLGISLETINDFFAHLGSRTNSFFNNTAILNESEINDFQRDIEDLQQSIIKNILEEDEDTLITLVNLTANEVKEIDEWVPLNKSMAEVEELLYNETEIKLSDIMKDMEDFIVDLKDIRKDSEILDSLLDIFEEVIDVYNKMPANHNTTIIEFGKELDLKMDDLADAFIEIWDDLKTKPLGEAIKTVDNHFTFVKLYATLVKLTELKVFNLYTLLNAIVYDETADPNFKEMFDFIYEFEDMLNDISTKASSSVSSTAVKRVAKDASNEGYTLYEVASLLLFPDQIFTVFNKTVDIYETEKVSPASLIMIVSDKNFSETQKLVHNILTKVSKGEPVKIQEFQQITDSIATVVDSDSPKPKPKKSKTVLIACVTVAVAVVVAAIAVGLFIFLRKKKESTTDYIAVQDV